MSCRWKPRAFAHTPRRRYHEAATVGNVLPRHHGANSVGKRRESDVGISDSDARCRERLRFRPYPFTVKSGTLGIDQGREGRGRRIWGALHLESDRAPWSLTMSPEF